jgi:hypothetical protein
LNSFLAGRLGNLSCRRCLFLAAFDTFVCSSCNCSSSTCSVCNSVKPCSRAFPYERAPTNKSLFEVDSVVGPAYQSVRLLLFVPLEFSSFSLHSLLFVVTKQGHRFSFFLGGEDLIVVLFAVCRLRNLFHPNSRGVFACAKQSTDALETAVECRRPLLASQYLTPFSANPQRPHAKQDVNSVLKGGLIVPVQCLVM